MELELRQVLLREMERVREDPGGERKEEAPRVMGISEARKVSWLK